MSTCITLFSFLNEFKCTPEEFKAGSWVFREGEGGVYVSFVLEGILRVVKEGENGRSITLYRLDPGDVCILSLLSMQSKPSYPASCMVEEDALVCRISVDSIRELLDRSPEARAVVFNGIASRLAEVLQLIEEILFRRIDERLATVLVQQSLRSGSDTVEMSHQQLAEECGTAREVVTRILRDFSEQGFIEGGRRSVVIRNRNALESFRN